jgi:predicted component of viral defense system (DUF524 family)
METKLRHKLTQQNETKMETTLETKIETKSRLCLVKVEKHGDNRNRKERQNGDKIETTLRQN